MNCPYVMRKCKKCGEVKFLFKFRKHKNSKYGYIRECEECKKQYEKQNKKRYYENNKETILKNQKQYYENNKEEIAEYQKQYYEYQKQYYENNRKTISEYKKQYRENNKEAISEKAKRYYENNREVILEIQKRYHETPQGQVAIFNGNSRRRQRLENQGNGITTEQWLEMMKFFEWKCAYSGEKLYDKQCRTIDHVVALDKGGLNEIWNTVPMYKKYNCSKHTQDMEEWYKKQSFYSQERLQKIYEWQEYAYNRWGTTN